MDLFTPENSPGVMEWLRAIEYLRDTEGLFPELNRDPKALHDQLIHMYSDSPPQYSNFFEDAIRAGDTAHHKAFIELTRGDHDKT